MSCKWIGAIFIVAGCGGFGFSVAANYRQEERRLRELIRALQLMQCELQYRLTPLPELCRLAGQASGGVIKEVLMGLAAELEWQTEPDAASCMDSVLKRTQTLSARSRRLLHQLGKTLGRFDLEGQQQGLQATCSACIAASNSLREDRTVRLRSYQTLGLCAGAALAILFL